MSPFAQNRDRVSSLNNSSIAAGISVGLARRRACRPTCSAKCTTMLPRVELPSLFREKHPLDAHDHHRSASAGSSRRHSRAPFGARIDSRQGGNSRMVSCEKAHGERIAVRQITRISDRASMLGRRSLPKARMLRSGQVGDLPDPAPRWHPVIETRKTGHNSATKSALPARQAGSNGPVATIGQSRRARPQTRTNR